MTTAMQNFQRRFKGISVSKLRDTATQQIFHLPNFDFTLNPGQEVEELEIASGIGSRGYAGQTIVAEKPSFEITFKHNAPEVLEMITGYKFQVNQNAPLTYADQFTIDVNGMVDPVTAGQLGDTIIQDDPGVSVSIIDDDFNYTLPLTQVPFATGPTTPLEYSIDAMGAMVFDPSLAGKNGTIAVNTIFAEVLQMSETQIGTYDLLSSIVLADSNLVALIEAKNCEVKLGAAQFSPSNPETSLTLMPISELGKCAAYSLAYTKLKVAC